MPRKKISSKEYARYQRHFSLREIGVSGQEKLKSSSVLLIGAGGLGSPIALYLAAAGIGRLAIVDFDLVDESNLQRQILHGTADIGQPKVTSALHRLQELNPYVNIETFREKLDANNARSLISQYDVIVDGTDNFVARYLINDACYFENRPLVSGAVFGFEGQVSVFHYENGPCYRCLFPNPPPPEAAPNCSESGVLGVLPGIIGTMQALEVLKIVAGFGEVLSSCVAYYNALHSDLTKFKFEKSPECPLCGIAPSIVEIAEEIAVCAVGGTATVVTEISMEEIASEASKYFLLIDVRTIEEREVYSIPGSIHIALAELTCRYHEIPRERSLVVYCQSGVRSRKAAEILVAEGFTEVKSLKGGINKQKIT